jgi:hypothetical protein
VRRAAPKRARPAPDPDAVTLAPDAGAKAPDAAADREQDAPEPGADTSSDDSRRAAAVSGMGLFDGASGDGSGSGPGGSGSGGGMQGGTIALNVDLERVRASALLLETQALLEIIPEWQTLLAGSGLDALEDFTRVFVAAPSLDRSSLVVSAEHRMSRARIGTAVKALAAESGAAASFREAAGVSVATWHNRGPTERVIALTAADQLVITRSTDLERVLAVSRALSSTRKRQGFDPSEVNRRGGLLAMQTNEAVALWIEDVPRYVRGQLEGVPESLRLSILGVDQFNTELQVTGNYRSTAAASAALEVMDSLRQELSTNERVIFLGLKSAMDAAVIEQQGKSLSMRVQLTLHQTRYLMAYVRRALRPKNAR